MASVSVSRTSPIEKVYAYSPYGEVATLGPDGGNSLQYTGRENDGTGLYDYRFRQYDPMLKRFISEDPVGMTAGPNFYAFVLGNPVSFVDPFGLDVTITYFPGGPGHVGIGINTSNTVGLYPIPHSLSMATGSTVPGVITSDRARQNSQSLAGATTVVIKTKPWQDALMQNYIDRRQGALGPKYNLMVDQCHSFVQAVLQAGGVAGPQGNYVWPSGFYDDLLKMYGGEKRK